MPISGHIDTGQTSHVATRSFYLLGADGNHYMIAGNSGKVTPVNAEALTIPHPITSGSWLTDLAGAGLPGYNGALTYAMNEGILPIAGNSKFYVMGADGTPTQAVFLRYRINADSTQSVDGGAIVTQDLSSNATGRPFGFNTIGNYSYAVYQSNGTIFSSGGYYLLQIPNSGTFTGTKYSNYVTQFQTATGSYFESPTGRYYTSRAAIVGDPAGIKILSYVGTPEIAGGPPVGTTLTTPGCEFWIVDPTSQTVVQALTNCQAAFGQPWPDSGTLYAGGVSASAYDDYVAPIVSAVTGGYELIFARPFSDNVTVFRFRRYFVNGTTGAINYVDTFEETISAGQGSASQVSMPFAMRDGNNLLFGASNDQDWWFGQFALTPATAAPPAAYYIERMDNRIWPTVEDAWCLDAALAYPMPEPAATLSPAAASGPAVAFIANPGVFTSTDTGSIIRIGGGKGTVTSYSSSTSIIVNITQPITETYPNDPFNTPIPATAGNWTLTVPTMTVSGLDHLEGMTVAALADGAVVSPLTVVAGTVTLTTAATAITVGLPFTAQLQTLYLEAEGANTLQSKRKNVVRATLRVQNSVPPQIGTNQPDSSVQPNQATIAWGASPYASLSQITSTVTTGVQPLYSGDFQITNVFDNWGTNGQIAVQQTQPLPLTVLALVPYVDAGDPE